MKTYFEKSLDFVEKSISGLEGNELIDYAERIATINKILQEKLAKAQSSRLSIQMEEWLRDESGYEFRMNNIGLKVADYKMSAHATKRTEFLRVLDRIEKYSVLE